MSQYTDTFKTHRTNIAKVAGSTTSLNIFNREAGAVILKTTYGYTAEPKGRDVLVDMAVKTMSDFSDATIPGKWPVDVMPFRKSHIPTHLHIT
jgi:hypothetical protein